MNATATRTRFVAYTLVAAAAAALSFGAANAQDIVPSSDDISSQTAAFTRLVSAQLNVHIAAPTTAMEARYAALDPREDVTVAEAEQTEESAPVIVVALAD